MALYWLNRAGSERRLRRTAPAIDSARRAFDLERGNRLELEWFSGTIHRLGREAGVATPVHDTIYAALRPFRNGAPAPVG